MPYLKMSIISFNIYNKYISIWKSNTLRIVNKKKSISMVGKQLKMNTTTVTVNSDISITSIYVKSDISDDLIPKTMQEMIKN